MGTIAEDLHVTGGAAQLSNLVFTQWCLVSTLLTVSHLMLTAALWEAIVIIYSHVKDGKLRFKEVICSQLHRHSLDSLSHSSTSTLISQSICMMTSLSV